MCLVLFWFYRQTKTIVSRNFSTFLGSIGRQRFVCFFLYRKSMKIIQNTLKIEKFSDVPKIFRVGPKKNVGSVEFPETSHFFFCLIPELYIWLPDMGEL